MRTKEKFMQERELQYNILNNSLRKSSMNLTILKQMEFGEEGEKVIEEYLINQNRVCMALRQFTPTFAPIITTYNGGITAPDIISFEGSNAIFVECKRKNVWIKGYNLAWNEYTSHLETGIDARLYRGYKELVQTTFIPLEIYFIQEDMQPLGIFRLKLDIETLERDANYNIFRKEVMVKGNKRIPMVFFAFELLEKINY